MLQQFQVGPQTILSRFNEKTCSADSGSINRFLELDL